MGAWQQRRSYQRYIVAELEPENHEEWWTYVSMGPSDPQTNWHLSMRGAQHRAVMWRLCKEGGTALLYWGANCYEKATFPSAEINYLGLKAVMESYVNGKKDAMEPFPDGSQW